MLATWYWAHSDFTVILTVDVCNEEDSGLGCCYGKPKEDEDLHRRSKGSGQSKDGKRYAAIEESLLSTKPENVFLLI